jgi:hypothetical protein
MATYPRCRVAEGQLTLAQLNAASGAGTTIVADVPGKTLTVVDAWFRSAAGGTCTGATAVVLEDTAGTDVLSVTAATLENAVIVRGGASGATATNFGTALGKGKGLRIGRTVGDVATMTAMDYCVLYKVDSD